MFALKSRSYFFFACLFLAFFVLFPWSVEASENSKTNQIGEDETDILYIPGKVGIGFNNPASKLTLTGGDFEIDNNKSIKISSSTANTILFIGNYLDGSGFGYGTSTTRTASLAIEGDLKANQLCIKDDCKAAWSDVVASGGGNQWTTLGVNIYNANTGNVGIGTSTPAQKLSVGVSTSDFIQSYGGFIGHPLANIGGTGDAAYFPEGIYSAKMNWLYGGIVMNNGNLSGAGSGTFSGNVGIGTTTPSYRLSISSSTADVINVGGGFVSGLNSTPVNANQAVPLGYLQSNYSSLSSALWSGTKNGNIWNGAAGAGNVGIGTTNPLTNLMVRGSASAGPASSGTTPNGITAITSANNNNLYMGAMNASPWGFWFQNQDSTNLGIYYPLLLNPNGGNVGIGTTNPAYKLAVNGDVYATGRISSDSDIQARDVIISEGYYSADELGLYSGIGDEAIAVFDSLKSIYLYGNRNLVIDSLGNVGIGTNVPSTKLEVDGIITARGFAGNASTASALAANPANCAAGFYPLGIAANGSVESCTPAPTIPASNITGSAAGTSGYIPKYTANYTLANSTIYDNGTNVGIGTTTPAQKLQVNGSIRGTGFCIGTSCISSWPSGAVTSVSNTDTTLTISPTTGAVVASLNLGKANTWTGAQTFNATSSFATSSFPGSGIWNAAGNVGIKTASPTNVLDVVTGANGTYGNYAQIRTSGSTAYQGGLFITNEVTQGTNHTSLKITSAFNDGINATARIGFVNNSATETYLNNGPAIELKYLGNILFAQAGVGNVGIGTTNPTTKLYVAGNTSLASGNFSVDTSGNVTAQSLVDLANSNYLIDPSNATTSINVAGAIVGGSLNLNEGNGVMHDLTLNQDDSSVYGNLCLGGICRNTWPVPKIATANYTLRGNGTDWVAASNLYNNGTNIGIGTTTLTYKLNVGGDVGATSFVYTSDRNLKKNIKTLDGALDKILKLRGVSFNWKDNNKPSVGLIAQEVEQVFPELVTGNEVKGVQYGNLVAPLIEAVKAQQQEIKNQDLTIQAQQEQIDGLNVRLHALEIEK